MPVRTLRTLPPWLAFIVVALIGLALILGLALITGTGLVCPAPA